MFAALVAIAFWPAVPDAERLPPPRLVRFDADGRRLPDGALLRLGTVARRHLTCYRLHWAADGKTFVTAGPASVKSWDAATGTILGAHALDTAADETTATASADGRRFAVATATHVEVRTVATGDVLTRVERGEGSYPYSALSADGSLVAVLAGRPADAPAGVRVAVRGVAGAKDVPLADEPWTQQPIWLEFAPDGRRVYAGTQTETRTYDLATGKVAWTLAERMILLAASADGRRIATDDGQGKALTLRDAATGRPLDAPAPEGEPSSWAALSADGSLLAHVKNRDIVVRDVKTGKTVATLPGVATSAVAFAPDGQALATTADTIELWDIAKAKRLWPDAKGAGHAQDVRHLAWSSDGRSLATAGWDGRVFLWDAASGKPFWRTDGGEASPMAVAVVGGEVRGVFQHFDDDANPTKLEYRAWDAAAGKPLRAVKFDFVPNPSLRDVALRPGYAVATEVGEAETILTAFDLATGKRVRTFREGGAQTDAGGNVFSPDGRYAFTAKPGFLRTDDFKPMPPLDPADPPLDLQAKAWSADGTLAAGLFLKTDGTGGSAVRVSERFTGRVVRRVRADRRDGRLDRLVAGRPVAGRPDPAGQGPAAGPDDRRGGGVQAARVESARHRRTGLVCGPAGAGVAGRRGDDSGVGRSAARGAGGRRGGVAGSGVGRRRQGVAGRVGVGRRRGGRGVGAGRARRAGRRGGPGRALAEAGREGVPRPRGGVEEVGRVRRGGGGPVARGVERQAVGRSGGADRNAAGPVRVGQVAGRRDAPVAARSRRWSGSARRRRGRCWRGSPAAWPGARDRGGAGRARPARGSVTLGGSAVFAALMAASLLASAPADAERLPPPRVVRFDVDGKSPPGRGARPPRLDRPPPPRRPPDRLERRRQVARHGVARRGPRLGRRHRQARRTPTPPRGIDQRPDSGHA